MRRGDEQHGIGLAAGAEVEEVGVGAGARGGERRTGERNGAGEIDGGGRERGGRQLRGQGGADGVGDGFGRQRGLGVGVLAATYREREVRSELEPLHQRTDKAFRPSETCALLLRPLPRRESL